MNEVRRRIRKKMVERIEAFPKFELPITNYVLPSHVTGWAADVLARVEKFRKDIFEYAVGVEARAETDIRRLTEENAQLRAVTEGRDEAIKHLKATIQTQDQAIARLQEDIGYYRRGRIPTSTSVGWALNVLCKGNKALRAKAEEELRAARRAELAKRNGEAET